MEEIWGKVLSCLQPPTTQALLKQQCHLISFDGSSAIVGISSATLQKLNQGKVPNIEKAFAQVVQHKVKVQLEVASRQNNPAKKNSTIKNNPIESAPQKPNSTENTYDTASIKAKTFTETKEFNSPVEKQVATPKPTSFNSSMATPAPPAPVQPVREISAAPQPTNPAIPIETNASSPSQPSMEQSLDADYEDTNLQKAIASLTQSFEGELVQMDSDRDLTPDTSEIDETEELLTIKEQSRPRLEDYDDDW